MTTNKYTARMLREAETLAKMRAKDPSLNKSIHPRVVRGRTAHTKVNTAKPPRNK
jgi:hypothetical protein